MGEGSTNQWGIDMKRSVEGSRVYKMETTGTFFEKMPLEIGFFVVGEFLMANEKGSPAKLDMNAKDSIHPF